MLGVSGVFSLWIRPHSCPMVKAACFAQCPQFQPHSLCVACLRMRDDEGMFSGFVRSIVRLEDYAFNRFTIWGCEMILQSIVAVPQPSKK